MTVLVNGEKHTVRLLACDAPEAAYFAKKPQAGSGPATTALKRLVLGKDVLLTADPGACERANCEDAYKRWLRYATVGAGDVSTQLVAGGLARAYLTEGLESPLGAVMCQVEATARAEKRGIFKLKKNPKPSQCKTAKRGTG